MARRKITRKSKRKNKIGARKNNAIALWRNKIALHRVNQHGAGFASLAIAAAKFGG